jgi:transposase
MQEASHTSDNTPSTFNECLLLIASLTKTITQHEVALKQKDALIETQSQAIDASLKERDALQTKIDEDTKTIERLLGIYQKRRERFERPRPLFDLLSEEVLDAEDEAIVEAITEVQESIESLAEQLAVPPKSKPRKKRDYTAPGHWPRVEVPYKETDPSVSNCPEHGPREVIDFEIREKAVMIPAKFYVEQTQVPKYKCVGHPECGIKQQRAPEGLVKGDKIDTSIAAQIVTQKHMHHVPLYRTQDIFASSGWDVGRGTLLNLLCSMAYLFEGLYTHYREQMVKLGPVIATDDTIVKLILPDYIPPIKPDDKWSKRVHEVLMEAFEKDKSSINARMWAYRSIGACPWNIFDFTISRHRDGPERFLRDFQGGTLLGDCYAGYDSLRVAKEGSFRLASCNSHARRKLYDAMGDHPKECSLLLAIYRELYDVESLVKTMTADERVANRQELSAPLFARMKEAIAQIRMKGRVVPKSKLGKALGYIENNWDSFMTYLTDGNCEIDNNLAEQLMKHTATGRKNWLFLGSIEAGYRAAILTTICSTAHRHHLDVYAYVKETADRLLRGDRDYTSMQPENWAKSHPEHVRKYREEESRYASDRKKSRRSERRREQAARARAGK